MKTEAKLERINRWMTLAASIGVLIGIFFLIFELRQNTTASRLEAASNFQDSFSEIEFLIAGNPEFAALLVKGRDGEAVDEVDELRLIAFYGNVLRTWQNTNLHYLSGALDEDLWRGSQIRLAFVLKDDRGLLEHWQRSKDQFSPAFNQMISDITAESDESP